MKNSCPKCNSSLKLKHMKTTPIKNKTTPKFIGFQVPTCPNYGALLESNPHPFDEKAINYLIYPFVIFIVGLIANQDWLKYLSAILLLASIVIIVKKITSKEYKSRNLWREYKEKI